MKIDKADEAIADFTRVVELQPNDAEGYRERREAYRKKGLFHLAGDDYLKWAGLRGKQSGAD